jgi:hypothetical protein
MVLFKGRVIFRQYTPKKHMRFGIKIYKHFNSATYIYDMKVYLGKDRQHMAQHLTATHATATELSRKTEGPGHKLYMDNEFSSLELSDDLTKKKINCCGNVRLKIKGMPDDKRHKTVKLRWGAFEGGPGVT